MQSAPRGGVVSEGGDKRNSEDIGCLPNGEADNGSWLFMLDTHYYSDHEPCTFPPVLITNTSSLQFPVPRIPSHLLSIASHPVFSSSSSPSRLRAILVLVLSSSFLHLRNPYLPNCLVCLSRQLLCGCTVERRIAVAELRALSTSCFSDLELSPR